MRKITTQCAKDKLPNKTSDYVTKPSCEALMKRCHYIKFENVEISSSGNDRCGKYSLPVSGHHA